MKTMTDGELVERALEGDASAFGTLIERHWRTITLLAYQKLDTKDEAEDVCQEAFLKAWEALDSLRNPEKFAAWLYHIALRLCIDRIRALSRRRPVSLDTLRDDRSLQLPAEPTDDPVVKAEEADRVVAAIGEMADHYRVVLVLRYYEGLTYREIAERLDAPSGTVANRLHRAHNKLEDALRDLAPGAEEKAV